MVSAHGISRPFQEQGKLDYSLRVWFVVRGSLVINGVDLEPIYVRAGDAIGLEAAAMVATSMRKASPTSKEFQVASNSKDIVQDESSSPVVSVWVSPEGDVADLLGVSLLSLASAMSQQPAIISDVLQCGSFHVPLARMGGADDVSDGPASSLNPSAELKHLAASATPRIGHHSIRSKGWKANL